MCNGDLDRPLKIEIWDHDSNGKHDSMGSVETNVRTMITNHGVPMNVIDQKDKAKKGAKYVNSGTLTAKDAMVETHPTFSQVNLF